MSKIRIPKLFLPSRTVITSTARLMSATVPKTPALTPVPGRSVTRGTDAAPCSMTGCVIVSVTTSSVTTMEWTVELNTIKSASTFVFLSYSILRCITPYYTVLLYIIILYYNTILHHITLYYSILLYYIIILYYTILHCITLYYSILLYYIIILYYTILHCITLYYYTIL